MCGLWENYAGKSFVALKYITRNIFKTWNRQCRTSRILENDAQQSLVDSYGWVLPMYLKCQICIQRINGGSFCLKSFPLFLYILFIYTKKSSATLLKSHPSIHKGSLG